MEQDYCDEASWTQKYQQIKTHNNNAPLNEMMRLCSTHVDWSHPYGGPVGHQIFTAYSNNIVKPVLTLFLENVQDMNAETLLSDISFENLMDSLFMNLGDERLEIAKLTNRDTRFGRKFSYSTQEMRDPINEQSFPAWNRLLQSQLHDIFQKILNDSGKDTIEATTFLQKLDGQESETMLFKTFGGNSFCILGGETPYLGYMGCYIVNLAEEFLNNITHESIKAYQHRIIFHHANYREDFYKVITPDFQKALLWDKKDTEILKTHLARILFLMAHSSTFMRGQAAITEWLLAGLSLAHGYQLKWSETWTGPNFPNPDQHALTIFNIDVFVNEFKNNTLLIHLNELSANL